MTPITTETFATIGTNQFGQKHNIIESFTGDVVIYADPIVDRFISVGISDVL